MTGFLDFLLNSWLVFLIVYWSVDWFSWSAIDQLTGSLTIYWSIDWFSWLFIDQLTGLRLIVYWSIDWFSWSSLIRLSTMCKYAMRVDRMGIRIPRNSCWLLLPIRRMTWRWRGTCSNERVTPSRHGSGEETAIHSSISLLFQLYKGVGGCVKSLIQWRLFITRSAVTQCLILCSHDIVLVPLVMKHLDIQRCIMRWCVFQGS